MRNHVATCILWEGHLFGFDEGDLRCLELATGADLGAVQIEVRGAEGLSIDADGALVFQTAVGTVRQPAPVTWEAVSYTHLIDIAPDEPVPTLVTLVARRGACLLYTSPTCA